MPVRHRKKSASSYLGWVYFLAEGRHIRHESALERDFLHHMHFIPSLLHIEEQPMRILQEERSYTPDFKLELRAGPPSIENPGSTHLIEIKPIGVLQKDWMKLKPRIELGAEFAKDNGWNFKILTELEIRSNDLKILQFLMRFIHIEPDHELSGWLIQQLHIKPRSLVDLLLGAKNEFALEPKTCLPTIWHLVAVREILTFPP